MKFTHGISLMLLCLFAFPVLAQPATERAAKAVCDCLGKYEMQYKSRTEAQQIFTNCFVEGAFSDISELAKESGYKVTEIDEAVGKEIGVKIGLKMAEMGCEPYMDYAKGQAEQNLEAPAEASEPQFSEGTFVRVEKTNMAYWVLKDYSGREQKFLWLYYFDQSERFLNEPERYVGKPFEVEWYEDEIFMPQLNDYAKVKVVKSVSYLE